eukprot:228450-Chlamydomonas_euryale.AAC.9
MSGGRRTAAPAAGFRPHVSSARARDDGAIAMAMAGAAAVPSRPRLPQAIVQHTRKGSGSSGCASTHALIAFSILSDRPCFLRYAMTLSGTAAAGTVEARRRRPAVARGATEASGNGCGRSNAAATLVDLRDGRRCARRATRDAVVLGSAACESSAQRGARGLCNKVSSLAKVGP